MSTDYQVVPLTEAPSQQLSTTLGGQSVIIRVYTKSVNVPRLPPGAIATDPPFYKNADPLFLDLYKAAADGTLGAVVLGVTCLHATRIVRDAYLGFAGDLAFYDLQGTDDPFGVPRVLPPYYLQSEYQVALPRSAGNHPADTSILGVCPGLGTRFVLTYWPNLD